MPTCCAQIITKTMQFGEAEGQLHIYKRRSRYLTVFPTYEAEGCHLYIGTPPDPLARWENELAEDVALVRTLKTYLIHRLMASGVLRLATLVLFFSLS